MTATLEPPGESQRPHLVKRPFKSHLASWRALLFVMDPSYQKLCVQLVFYPLFQAAPGDQHSTKKGSAWWKVHCSSNTHKKKIHTRHMSTEEMSWPFERGVGRHIHIPILWNCPRKKNKSRKSSRWWQMVPLWTDLMWNHRKLRQSCSL